MAVADLHDQGVEVDDRVGALQRPGLPFPDLFEHPVGDLRDRVGGKSVPIVRAR